MSALLADLQAKGLLDQTLVVLGTEFGPLENAQQRVSLSAFPSGH
jgi:hypothetical protein